MPYRAYPTISTQTFHDHNDLCLWRLEAQISGNVVPVTKEDDRIHNYQIPSDNCFAHLETQFGLDALSLRVEGVTGRTYQPDFKNPAKPGVAMPVDGGEDKYRKTCLLSTDCNRCLFAPAGVADMEEDSLVRDHASIDCTGDIVVQEQFAGC